jgi:lipopolysaccharide transport system ATP-binding protein
LEVGTGFHPELTGRENIYLNGAILGMMRSDVRRQFDNIVAFAEIEKFIDTPVKRYSSGMYVRLAFAVASHLEPDVLIVDEVLAVGDAGFQAKCLGRLGDVSKTGRTILFVSHNLGAIQELCTSAILLANGRITFTGTAGDAIAQYTSSLRNTSDERPRFSGPLKSDLDIKTLEVLQEGEPKIVLSPRRPTTIRIQGVVNRDFRELDLVVGIFRDGIRLFSCFDAPPGTGIHAGLFTAEYLLPEYIFRPGRYIMSFAASRNDGTDWLWVPDLFCFDVAQEWDAVVRQLDNALALMPYEGRRLQNDSNDYPAIRGAISSGAA